MYEENVVIENNSGMELAKVLAHLLSDVVTLSHIARGYHWNVNGPDFKEMHAFFADIYEDVEESIDPLAENILKLGFDSPYFTEDFVDLTCIKGVERIEDGSAISMVESLYEINGHVIGCVKGAFNSAVSADEQAIANFLADRLGMHQKWNWQLKATLGIK